MTNETLFAFYDVSSPPCTVIASTVLKPCSSASLPELRCVTRRRLRFRALRGAGRSSGAGGGAIRACCDVSSDHGPQRPSLPRKPGGQAAGVGGGGAAVPRRSVSAACSREYARGGRPYDEYRGGLCLNKSFFTGDGNRRKSSIVYAQSDGRDRSVRCTGACVYI